MGKMRLHAGFVKPSQRFSQDFIYAYLSG